MASGKEEAASGQDVALNLKTGDKLPEFTLDAWAPGGEEPVEFSSALLTGKTACAIYFYPADDTAG